MANQPLFNLITRFGVADVVLTDAEYARIGSALEKIKIHGNRTDEDIAKLVTHK